MTGALQPCPVEEEVQAVLHLSGALSTALVTLRRRLAGCEGCHSLAECAFRRSFNASINTAIQQVFIEWNIRV